MSLIGLIICKKCKLPVAEKEGFEPSRQSPQPTPLAGEPLTATWVLLHGIRFYAFTHLAEREGLAPAAPPPITPGRLKRATGTLYRRRRTLPFESHHSFLLIWRRERDSNPRCLATSLVFKTSSINHSDISPQAVMRNNDYSKTAFYCQVYCTALFNLIILAHAPPQIMCQRSAFNRLSIIVSSCSREKYSKVSVPLLRLPFIVAFAPVFSKS